MRARLDAVWCQLFHGRWAELVSYSRQGAWRCTKPGCRAQERVDRLSGDHTSQAKPRPEAAPDKH
jgi:hypothetical protein